METWVESRAPLEPMGSFTTCTSRVWPSERIFSMGFSCPSPLRAIQMSATCRNAARASPISTNADCMPGSTRQTRPR